MAGEVQINKLNIERDGENWKVGMWDVESALNVDIEGIDIDSKMNVKYYNE